MRALIRFTTPARMPRGLAAGMKGNDRSPAEPAHIGAKAPDALRSWRREAFTLAAALVPLLALTAAAQGLPPDAIAAITNAYRSYKTVSGLSFPVPTVVEVPFTGEFIERFDFAVLDTTAQRFEPHLFTQQSLVSELPVTVSTIPANSAAANLIDHNTLTFADFPLIEDVQGSVRMVLTSAQPITSSSLTALLAPNVALPTSVELWALINGQDQIIVAPKAMTGQTVSFPQTTSTRFTVAFTFGQPLRITELRLQQDNAAKQNIRTLRFLAQPGHAYQVYFDPDRQATPPFGEAGNLAGAKDVLVLSPLPSQTNPGYTAADVDSDGVPDLRDNCVAFANADQLDVSGNGRGDACDDFDQDGLINAKDNCPNQPNLEQRDADSDGVGDVCDGQESRITERYPWLPWVGIGFAALVLVVLFALTARSPQNPAEPDAQQ